MGSRAGIEQITQSRLAGSAGGGVTYRLSSSHILSNYRIIASSLAPHALSLLTTQSSSHTHVRTHTYRFQVADADVVIELVVVFVGQPAVPIAVQRLHLRQRGPVRVDEAQRGPARASEGR